MDIRSERIAQSFWLRTLATQIRSYANRQADIDDEADIEPEPPAWVPKFKGVRFEDLAKASIGADENSGRDMGMVLANVDRISSAFPKAGTVLVHHLKAGGTKLRGRTSLYANVDQVILVVCDEETKVRTATLDKQKDGERADPTPRTKRTTAG
jgi:hypothetical protein